MGGWGVHTWKSGGGGGKLGGKGTAVQRGVGVWRRAVAGGVYKKKHVRFDMK